VKTEQRIWNLKQGWIPSCDNTDLISAQLVLVFGQRQLLVNPDLFLQIKTLYPAAHLFGCSTAGEIIGTQVLDGSVVLTAIEFEYSRVEGIQISLALADAYDTMTNNRPYRQAMQHEQAVQELQRCAGTQFDPELTKRFIKSLV